MYEGFIKDLTISWDVTSVPKYFIPHVVLLIIYLIFSQNDLVKM